MRIRLAKLDSLPPDGSLEDLFHGSELSYDAQRSILRIQFLTQFSKCRSYFDKSNKFLELPIV